MVVHGRFQRYNLSKTSKKSVILTAVGVKAKDETVIIKLKHGAPKQNMNEKGPLLDVIVNGEFQFYDRDDNKWQDFSRKYGDFTIQIYIICSIKPFNRHRLNFFSFSIMIHYNKCI